MEIIDCNLLEYYEKGQVVEVTDSIPLIFSDSCVHMKVGYGSKVKNLIGFALKKIKEPGVSEISWTGHGKGFQKTLSCAEIFKKKVKGLHKVTNLRYKRTEEYWEPKMEGLDRLKVNIDVPAVTVLLTKERTEQPVQSWPKEVEVIWRSALKDVQKPQPSEEVTERRAGHKYEQDKKEFQKDKKDGSSRFHKPRNSAGNFNNEEQKSQEVTNEQSKADTKKKRGTSTKVYNDRTNTQSRRSGRYSNNNNNDDSSGATYRQGSKSPRTYQGEGQIGEGESSQSTASGRKSTFSRSERERTNGDRVRSSTKHDIEGQIGQGESSQSAAACGRKSAFSRGERDRTNGDRVRSGTKCDNVQTPKETECIERTDITPDT